MSGIRDAIRNNNRQHSPKTKTVVTSDRVIYYNGSTTNFQPPPMVSSIGVHEFPHTGFGGAIMQNYQQRFR
jgi:hypothetical protein